MAKRKRKYIPLKEKLAAALACLLPQGERDALRDGKVRPEVVIRRFEMDHIHLHSFGGSDDWWNLDPKLKAPHREKSRRDTSIVAKVKRLSQRYEGRARVSTYLVTGAKPPRTAAGKPKPKAKGKQRVAKGRATDVPRRSWGRPMAGTIASGWKRKFNGEVERR